MKVELFLGEDAPDVEAAVTQSLRSLSEHAELEVLHLRSVVQGASSIAAARRYAQLLDAATPIRTYVDTHSVMGWAFYLRVYWHLDDDPYGPTSAKDFYGDQDFRAFFPALAVRERMVLVPQSQRSILPPGLPGSRADPFLSGDLTSVEFTDAGALQQALVDVSGAVQRELAREARQLRRQFPSMASDPAALATALGVHEDDLSKALAADSAFAEAIDGLECELAPTTFGKGRWTRARLSVANASPVALGRLDLVVDGPAQVRPDGLFVDLAGAGTVALEFALNPDDAGEFPLEFRLSPPADSPMRDEVAVRHLWLVSED
jgi:hypothetical protein